MNLNFQQKYLLTSFEIEEYNVGWKCNYKKSVDINL